MMEDVRCDIDLVIPMVFPDDPEWSREYARCKGGDATKHVRYRSWGTEELLVRCVMKYIPWVRCIYVLLARESQKQEWMDALSRYNGITELRLVYHKDFIPREYLPCYASPCIEMFLHRIPRLSEQFIYANDDMFPLSALEPTDFFRPGEPNGTMLPCQHIYEEPYPSGPNIFQRKCMNQQNMIGKEFGRHYTNTWLRNGHGFAPILKSTCEVVWWRHEEEIRKHLSPLRRTDHSYNHYIYLLYQHFSGRMVDGKLRTQLINGDTPAKDLAGIIRDPEAGVVCINDNENIADWRERARIVRETIAEKLTAEVASTGRRVDSETAGHGNVALVGIGRLENAYAREWVEHHLRVGFDHIIICDNNHDGEERFENVLGDYVERGVVTIESFRNVAKAQRLAYNAMYQKYGGEYDWIAFFDFDEFLCLGDGLSSVKELVERHEDKADCIMVPWMMMSDSGLVRKDDRPVMERFTERAADVAQGKCIVRGGVNGLRFTRSVHVPYEPVLRCLTPTGEPTEQTRHQKNDFRVAWLKHFSTKTIEEWMINKWEKGAAGVTYERFVEQYRDYFFQVNERTKEKELFIQEYQNRKRMEQLNKIALCAIGRRENQYEREFVAHYLGMGFDHIYMYDNNREGEERLKDALGGGTTEKKVTIVEWPKEEDAQRSAYNDCYARYGKQYDWMAFFDFDEFLHIVSGEDIHSFMNKYRDFQCVLVNWMNYTDNNLLHNDGRSVQERFTVPMEKNRKVGGDFPENDHVKSIVRTGIAGVKFEKNPHVPTTPVLKCCKANGKVCKQKARQPYNHTVAYLKHYPTKTIEEWLTTKWRRGVPDRDIEQFRKDYANFFFLINERTKEKEEYIRQRMQHKGKVAAVALGRMGNQMFEAAAAMTFARRTGREFVGLVYKLGDKFDFDYPKGQFDTVMRKVKYLQPDEVKDFYQMKQGAYISNGFPIVEEEDVVLCDYYQDNTCIDRDIALELFRPYPSILQEIADLYGNLDDVVCVNVRRGDYLQVQQRGFRVLTKEQIEDMLDEHFADVKRVLFVSDDVEWCRRNFGPATKGAGTGRREYLFADKACRYKPEMDLYLQTQCGRGNIIANSSFSWWGAYLNEKGGKVVCPWPWFDSPKKPKMTCLLPEGWIKQGREYRLWVTYHKEELIEEYHLDQLDEHYQLYAAQQDPMNSCMSEFVTLRHVWEEKLRTDYVGFNHYRRLFRVTRLPQRGECQVLKQIHFRRGETMRDQYARCHNVKDLDLMLELIDKRYGEQNLYSHYLRTSTTMITNVCFLMAWKDFVKMGDFLFPLLKDFAEATGCGEDVERWHEKAVKDFNEEDAPYQQRLLGFLGERLVSAWIAINLRWYV